MGDLTIFKEKLPANYEEMQGKSKLGETLKTGSNVKRIQTNNKGTFRKIVGGQAVGKPVKGAFKAIIVDLLPDIQRTFYAKAWDPNAKPEAPDCMSNDGRKPLEGVKNKQAAACDKCPQNITGSGQGGRGRACRYGRRVALLLAGDPTGDVYQFNIPATSLFGDGDGHVHPFESYIRFLAGNDFSPDRVVTLVEYDEEDEGDTFVLQFSPVRPITTEELEMVEAAQDNPDTRKIVEMSVAQADGAKSEEKPKPKAKAKPKKEEPEEDPFGGGEVVDAEYEEVEEEPAPKKRKTKTKAKATAADVESPEMADALSGWLDDEDED